MSNQALAIEAATVETKTATRKGRKGAMAAAMADAGISVNVPPMLVVDNTKGSEAAPWVANPVSFILTHRDAIEASMDAIHGALCFMLAEFAAVNANGATVTKDQGLEALFSAEFKGDVRAKIARWFGEYSPILVRFHKNGQFEKIAWNSKRWNASKADGAEPAYDLEGARANPWYESARARTKAATAPDWDSIAKSLTWQLARMALKEGTTIQQAIDTLAGLLAPQIKGGQEMPSKLHQAISDYAAGEKFQEWATQFQLEQELAARVAASKPKSAILH